MFYSRLSIMIREKFWGFVFIASLYCIDAWKSCDFSKKILSTYSVKAKSIRRINLGMCLRSKYERPAVEFVLDRFCCGRALVANFQAGEGIVVRGLQAQADFSCGDVIAEVPLDPIIAVPFRLGNDPWYGELAARLLMVSEGSLRTTDPVTRSFAVDLFESLEGTFHSLKHELE